MTEHPQVLTELGTFRGAVMAGTVLLASSGQDLLNSPRKHS